MRVSKIVALARENEMQIQEDQDLDLLQPPEDTPEDHTAVDDMIGLQNTADMINETIDDNGEGLDPLAADLVQDQIANAVERYQLQMSVKGFSRESFRRSKLQISRQLAREAEEASKGILSKIKQKLKGVKDWLLKKTDQFFTLYDNKYREIRAMGSRYKDKNAQVTQEKSLPVVVNYIGSKSLLEGAASMAKAVEDKRFTKVCEELLALKTDLLKSNGNVFSNGSVGGRRLWVEMEKGEIPQLRMDFTFDTKKGQEKIDSFSREDGLKIIEHMDDYYRGFGHLLSDLILEKIKADNYLKDIDSLNPFAAVCLSVFSNIFRLTMDIFTYFHENAMRALEANLSNQ